MSTFLEELMGYPAFKEKYLDTNEININCFNQFLIHLYDSCNGYLKPIETKYKKLLKLDPNKETYNKILDFMRETTLDIDVFIHNIKNIYTLSFLKSFPKEANVDEAKLTLAQDAANNDGGIIRKLIIISKYFAGYYIYIANNFDADIKPFKAITIKKENFKTVTWDNNNYAHNIDEVKKYFKNLKKNIKIGDIDFKEYLLSK